MKLGRVETQVRVLRELWEIVLGGKGSVVIAETVTIDVRQEHIDAAVPHNPWRCPIARAARVAGFKSATMHINGELTLTAQKGYAPSYWNHDAGEYADAFDCGKPVKPRSFVFERPGKDKRA